VPKDGPSAGITLAAALVSAFTGRKVRRDVAMTGEITLRGRVLQIGGVKEKVLGAHRAGIHHIILPRQNERDISEVPSHVKRKLTFLYVDHMQQVLDEALLPPAEKKSRRSTSKKDSNTAAANEQEQVAAYPQT
jgi:ATP-dependent Lon protease